ncbi:MAG: BTAD domain-containing putative transcriptional regulator [Gemmatimonadaceae bacterium]
MLRILTFGGMSVAHPERELAGAVLQPRRLALLAVLARAGERGVTRERLLTLFWPDDEEERARKALTQAVYALRRDLGDDGTIVGTQELRLDAELIASDVAEFAQQIKRGRLTEAVALYAGPFLQGFHLVGVPAFERWADEERSALAHEYARTRERLALSAENGSHMQEAVEHWRVLASVDPLNANVAVRYMRALEATGDRAGALSHARIYEALMSQELELPPDRAVLELAAELRRKAPVDIKATVAASEAIASAAPAPISAAASVTTPVDIPKRRISDSHAAVVPTNATPHEASASVTPTPGLDGIVSGYSEKLGVGYVFEPLKSPTTYGKRLAYFGLMSLVVFLLALFSINRTTTDIAKLHIVDTKRVTFEETLELDPAISPDGKLVAYAGGTEGSMRLYVRQLDGGNPVLISGSVAGDHRRPRWSPDGTRILFQADRAIWLVPSLGGSARVVVDAPGDTNKSAMYAAWAPDGVNIAWVQDGAIMRRDVNGKTALTIAHLNDAHSITWSPDGNFIAAATDNESFVYGARGTMRFAGASIGNIAPGVIYTVNAKTGDTSRVTEINNLSTSPEWLPDSRTIVYVSNQEGTRDLYAVAINASGARVGVPIRLTTGLDAHTVSVAADGHTVAYTTFRQSANLWAVNINSSVTVSVKDAESLTRGQQTIEAMDVSPDGKWIAFDSDRGGQQDIFRMRTDGVGETDRIVSNPTDDFHPAWSPDGRTIAFYRIRDGVRRGVVVDANGGNERYVGPTGGTLEEHSPTWTVNGQQLFFHRFNRSQPDLFSISRKGDSAWSAPTRVTEHGGIWPTFSSDGNEFAYFSTGGEISVMPVNGAESSRHIVVAKGANGVTAMYARWIPGKRALMVRAADANGNISIWEVPLDGSAWRSLVRFDDTRRPSMRPEFATDGRRVYFTLSDRTADVFTARLQSR